MNYYSAMRVESTELDGVKLIVPKIFGDERGWFAEMFNAARLAEAGLPVHFVQDNQSFSQRGVLRGLHYQVGKPQGKLVRVLSGEVFDIAVDIREKSATFGRWAGFILTEKEANMLWIPEGFAHGFLVISDSASVLYKTTDYYYPEGERTIRWDDATLKIEWPLEKIKPLQPVVSAKDAAGKSFLETEKF
jgi:dTDP-4-dehydrorhamnose 3,5-epimerase